MCDTTGMKKIERGDEVKTRDERESCFGGFAPRRYVSHYNINRRENQIKTEKECE